VALLVSYAPVALQAEAAEGDELAAEWLDRVSATLGVDVALVALVDH
jgi:predicted NBD/HSP70 family sugar kinase